MKRLLLGVALLSLLPSFASVASAQCLTGVTLTSPNGGEAYTVGRPITLRFSPHCPTSIPPCCPVLGADWYISTESGSSGSWTFIGHTGPSSRTLTYYSTIDDCSDTVRFRVTIFGPGSSFSDSGNGDCEIRCRVPDADSSSVGFYSEVGNLIVLPDPAANNLTIDVTVKDATGTTIPGIEVSWVFGPNLYECSTGEPSGITDANGQVSLQPVGGGYGSSEIRASIGAGPEYVSLTNWVTTRSPDYDGAGGDGDVDLSDYLIFSNEYLGHWNTDFHDYDNSGYVSLGDLITFSTAFLYGEDCSGGGTTPLHESEEVDSVARTNHRLLRGQVAALSDPIERSLGEKAVETIERALGLATEADISPQDPTSHLDLQPNPFRDEVSLQFGFARGNLSKAEVFDVAGRHVRTIFSGEADLEGTLAWDARTDAGVRAVSGVYFVSITSVAGEKVTKSVVLR